jgi:phosphoglycerate dehydrogenase-like enzyme
MSQVIWSQWQDLQVPTGFTSLHPGNCNLDSADLSAITFYVPQYMGGKQALEYSKKMSSLKYLQVPNAGFDDAIEYLKPGTILCNARGVHDDSTAELAVGLAIAVRRGFPDFVRAQDRGEWAHKRHQSFSDSVVAIVGYGSIGQSLVKKLSGFELSFTAFSRSGKDGAKTLDQLDVFLAKADIVFLTLPLNAESKHLFNKERFAKMKDGSLIVNVGRGPIIDTDALLAELNSGRIFAGLDVTDPEPLPSDHPLWRAPNLLIAPHVGGDSTAFEARGKKLVEEQLARLSEGTELINIVGRG